MSLRRTISKTSSDVPISDIGVWVLNSKYRYRNFGAESNLYKSIYFKFKIYFGFQFDCNTTYIVTQMKQYYYYYYGLFNIKYTVAPK